MWLCPPTASGGQYVIYAIIHITRRAECLWHSVLLDRGRCPFGRAALFPFFSERLFAVHVLTYSRILGGYRWEKRKWHFALKRNGTAVTIWSLAKPWRVAVAACFLYLYVNFCIAQTFDIRCNLCNARGICKGVSPLG